jgi:hypothetical protein
MICCWRGQRPSRPVCDPGAENLGILPPTLLRSSQVSRQCESGSRPFGPDERLSGWKIFHHQSQAIIHVNEKYLLVISALEDKISRYPAYSKSSVTQGWVSSSLSRLLASAPNRGPFPITRKPHQRRVNAYCCGDNQPETGKKKTSIEICVR